MFLDRVRIRYRAFVDRQPPRMRPVYLGAGLIAELILFRKVGIIGTIAIATFTSLKQGVIALVLIVATFVIGVFGGGVGGAVYSMLAPLQKFGLPGRWLRWTLASAAYLTAGPGVLLLLVGTYLSEPEPVAVLSGDLTLRDWLAVFGITAMIAGSFGFWAFGHEPKNDRPIPLTPGQIIRKAVGRDVRSLAASGRSDTRAALVAIHARLPSEEYVAHLRRVLTAIESMQEVEPSAKASAVARVQRSLRAAQRPRIELRQRT